MSLSNSQKKYLKKIKRNKILVFSIQIFLILFFIIGWELLAKYNIINSFIFSSPSKIVTCFVDLFKANNLFVHIYTTLYEVFLSFLIGICIGFIVALLIYIFPLLYKVLEPFLTMLNSLPKVALGPLLIIWFGANTKSIIIMALLINVIISIFNIYNGFQSVEGIKIKMMESLHASKWQVLRYVVIPNSYPTIISSLKINISMTLIGITTDMERMLAKI